jgi:hypothetical protein
MIIAQMLFDQGAPGVRWRWRHFPAPFQLARAYMGFKSGSSGLEPTRVGLAGRRLNHYTTPRSHLIRPAFLNVFRCKFNVPPATYFGVLKNLLVKLLCMRCGSFHDPLIRSFDHTVQLFNHCNYASKVVSFGRISTSSCYCLIHVTWWSHSL